MDIITIETINNLELHQCDWCVSLFLPTHRTGRETEQDPIRFKNLLREAEDRLKDKGMGSRQVQRLLKPAHNLLSNALFWSHQSDGLAVFSSPKTFRYYRLPLLFDELVVISQRFHLKPLIPMITSDGHFYLLALSQNQVRLWGGTRHTVDEIDIAGMPGSLAEVLQFEKVKKQLQFHTHTPRGTGARSAIYYGHDGGKDSKRHIQRWFHQIDDHLRPLLTGGESPLILAGVDYLRVLYREINGYPHLLGEGIPGNPDEQKLPDLHARAWELVQPYFLQGQQKAAEQYRNLIGTGRTSTDLKEVLVAAHHGRIEFLFLELDIQVWGDYDTDTHSVTLHPEAEPEDQDLLDLAAIQAIRNGGRVYAVAPQQMPDHEKVAAIFRY